MGVSKDTAATNAANLEQVKYANDSNRKIAQETNAANLNLAQLQNQWQIDMFNMTNAYNAPSAEVERLRQAGLNPNLYGLSANQVATMPQSANLANQQTGAPMQAATMLNPADEKVKKWQTILQSLDEATKVPQKIADVKEAYSRISKNYADVGMSQSNIKLNESLMRETNEKIRLALQQQITERAKQGLLRSQTKASDASADLSFAQSEFYRNTTPSSAMFNERYNAETSGIKANTRVADKQVELMGVEIPYKKALTLLTGKQMQEVAKNIDLKDTEIKQLNTQIDNALKTGNLLNQQLEINGYRLSIVENEAHQVEIRTQLLDESMKDAAPIHKYVRYVYQYLNQVANVTPMVNSIPGFVSPAITHTSFSD